MHLGVRLFHSTCPRCRTRCSFTRAGDAWAVSCHCSSHRFPWSPGEELRKGYPGPRFNAVGFSGPLRRLRHVRDLSDFNPRVYGPELHHRSGRAHPAAVSLGDFSPLVVRCLRRALSEAALRACERYRARLHEADIQSAFAKFIQALSARLARTESEMLAHWRGWRDGGMRSVVQVALLAPQVPEFPIRITLNSEDTRLAEEWPQRADEDKHEWIDRVHSARAAERAALAYYDSFSETRPVEDVSFTQLSSSKDPHAEWRSCDLTASGRPIDVKNVRFESCSKSRTRYYSEYVLQPKYYGRDHPSPVTILGARTRWNGDIFESQILGEWDVSVESSLSERARSLPGAVSVQWIPSRHTPSSLPGWLLEYPRNHYSSFRRAWVDAWTRIESSVDGTPVPLWLVAVAAAHGCSAERLPLSVRPRVDRELLQMLSRFFNSHIPSRPSLVLFVLIWLSNAGRNGNLESAADALQRGFWGPSCSRTGFAKPLGLYDPLEYVRAWMEIFVQLWQSDPSMYSRLRTLSLVGRGLLRGKFGSDGEERTLVAYCGGCSRYPLVHGDAPSCGCIRLRLRCPWCHYCQHSCPRNRCSSRPESTR